MRCAQRFDLEIINIMNNDGSLNAAAGAYEGLDRFEARKKLWADIKVIFSWHNDRDDPCCWQDDHIKPSHILAAIASLGLCQGLSTVQSMPAPESCDRECLMWMRS